VKTTGDLGAVTAVRAKGLQVAQKAEAVDGEASCCYQHRSVWLETSGGE
jgi:hypothetical protein